MFRGVWKVNGICVGVMVKRDSFLWGEIFCSIVVLVQTIRFVNVFVFFYQLLSC